MPLNAAQKNAIDGYGSLIYFQDQKCMKQMYDQIPERLW